MTVIQAKPALEPIPAQAAIDHIGNKQWTQARAALGRNDRRVAMHSTPLHNSRRAWRSHFGKFFLGEWHHFFAKLLD